MFRSIRRMPHLDRIRTSTLVWEDHCYVSFDQPARWLPGLARFRAAGYDLVHLNVGDALNSFTDVMSALARIRHWLFAHSDEYVLALTLDDARRAKRQGKLAVCFDVEGAYS